MGQLIGRDFGGEAGEKGEGLYEQGGFVKRADGHHPNFSETVSDSSRQQSGQGLPISGLMNEAMDLLIDLGLLRSQLPRVMGRRRRDARLGTQIFTVE